MSYKNNSDPRTQRSREWMRTALFNLIAEKEYEKISITEITDRAGLSRPTFYLHYSSKEEILIEYFSEIFTSIFEEYVSSWKKGEFNQPAIKASTKIFEQIAQNADLFKAMIHSGQQDLITEKLRYFSLEYLQHMVSRYKKVHPQPVLDLLARYLAGAWTALIVEWLEGKQPYTAEQMGATYIKISQLPLRAVIHEGLLDDLFESRQP